MSDLTGTDAFELVVDKMVEAEKRAATAQESTNGSRHQIAALQQTLNNVRSDLATATLKLKDYAGADDAFTKLYDAAESSSSLMAAVAKSESPNVNKADLLMAVDVLRAAVAGAKKFVDPIPF